MKIDKIEYKMLTTKTGKKMQGYEFTGEKSFVVYDFLLEKKQAVKACIEELMRSNFPMYVKIKIGADKQIEEIGQVQYEEEKAAKKAYTKTGSSTNDPRQESIEKQNAINNATHLMIAQIRAGVRTTADPSDLLELAKHIYAFHKEL